MYESYPKLKYLLLGIEFFSALVAILYYSELKHGYWKWFILFLIIISLQELTWFDSNNILSLKKRNYYTYFGIPFQYLFLYWLYAYKSLKKLKMFFLCSLIYLLSFLPLELSGVRVRVLYSLSSNMGNIILMFLVVLEFLKQIKNDNILNFGHNKMFYINIGVILFYIGTFPFFAFYHELLENVSIWNAYYLYFIISNCTMYLLFTASFICGKHQS